MVEGTEIVYGYRYFFYKDGTASRNSATIVPEDINDNSYLLKNLKEDTDLQRFVAYADGVLMYRTRTENDFLDLSGLEGLSLMLVLSDHLKLSALYAPGVNLKLKLTNGAYVTFRHSTRYKNKTGCCPQNATTGAGIDLAQSEGI